LPYAELHNSFDVVISVEVIEHLFYPRELVKAAKQCLKPNGCLIITTPYHGYFKNLVLAISGKYADIYFRFAGRLPYLWKSMLCCCTRTES